MNSLWLDVLLLGCFTVRSETLQKRSNSSHPDTQVSAALERRSGTLFKKDSIPSECDTWTAYRDYFTQWLHLTTRVTSEKLFKSFQPPFFILKTHKHRNIHENPVLLTNKVHWSIHTESTCSFHSRWADKSEPAILEWSRLHLPLSTK